jgi:hypothetical protein
MEEWRDIKGFENIYQISNLGRVKSLGRELIRSNGCKQNIKERILKHGKDGKGYHMVILKNISNKRNTKVHHLVAESFLNHNKQNNLIVDHIDNDKDNNKLNNLQLISQRLNTIKDKKVGSSKYVGVSWCKTNKKFRSTIQILGKSKTLGYFKCELAASKAYQDKLAEYEKAYY